MKLEDVSRILKISIENIKLSIYITALVNVIIRYTFELKKQTVLMGSALTILVILNWKFNN